MLPCVLHRYVPLNATVPGEHNWPNVEDTSMFAVSGFQYILMALVVTKAHPHKKPLYYNCNYLPFSFVHEVDYNCEDTCLCSDFSLDSLHLKQPKVLMGLTHASCRILI